MQLQAGAFLVAYSLPRKALSPPVLCQLVLAHSKLGHVRRLSAVFGLEISRRLSECKRYSIEIAGISGCDPSRPNIGIGCRRVRAITKLRSEPLLSRQAVQVLGRHQQFSTRKARELLGWAPRVDYATGLYETVRWLEGQHH